MEIHELNIVTGSFGYTGKYITKKLLAMGKRVKTLTGHPDRPNPFDNQVSVAPFQFDNLAGLTKSMAGASTLYNTYWIRFPFKQATFDKAVQNTRTLIKAAQEAGITKIAHISITNASEKSPFPYFRGKGIIEKFIEQSSLSYAIIRPTVLFGHEDILINNITWFLRYFPVFAVMGTGDYELQPVFVEDVAAIAVHAAQQKESVILDAVGPETYTFDELIRFIAGKIRSKARIIHLRPRLAYFFSLLLGYAVNDVVLTRDEVDGLMEGLLVSKASPTGETALSRWLDENVSSVGKRYVSELNRHYRS
ncbi:MAG: NAD(P)H-binding protein [Candidatus Brocadiaceae bacterium]|nr:NAD(P)H-binding protein [Candidatus Brocadiaceae bacterium]